jgi:hypothetical protein
MDPALEHQDLGPPRPSRVVMRGLPVAIVAHVLFAFALGWGVQWKRQPDPAMAAVPLPPVTAGAPANATASMGAGPAPQQPANAAAATAPPPARAENAPPQVARNTAPAERVAPPERVAPSFDCRLARSVPEKIICADAELSRLDRDLGRLHARAKAAAPDAAAFRRQNDAEWRRREQACRDRDCLLRWYAQRRGQLEAALAAANRRNS